MPFPKIVETPHYHLWTDALHGRALAKQAKNRWDRGTYVRWTVTTAWTVLEMACADALESPRIGYSFKQNLDKACADKAVPQIEWGRGLWQQVLSIQQARKDYVHKNATQRTLFPEVAKADHAISTIRDAINDIFARVGKPPPDWLQDDDDKGWDQGPGMMAHAQIIHAGGDPKGEETVRISFVHKDREYDYEFCPPGTDPKPFIEHLLQSVRIPIAAVRAYRGNTMTYERRLQMRGT